MNTRILDVEARNAGLCAFTWTYMDLLLKVAIWTQVNAASVNVASDPAQPGDV